MSVASSYCCPSPYPQPFPSPRPCPPPWYRDRDYHSNIPDAKVGETWDWQGGCFGLRRRDVNGYAIDLDGNGRYDRGRDGVLAFDLNRDGKVDQNEIEESNRRLKAFGGDFDANNDGHVSWIERIQGRWRQNQMRGYDTDGDGRLSASELDAAGGRVLVDHNRDGKFGRWEQYSPHSFPTPGFGRGSIGYVDPRGNCTAVDKWRRGGWYRPPCYGYGRQAC